MTNEKRPEVERRLAEIRARLNTEWAQHGYAHEMSEDVRYLLSLLQQPATSERRECVGPTEATQVAVEADKPQYDLDPLEFWQDLAEALGHVRPAKADVPALVSEVSELRAELSAARDDIARFSTSADERHDLLCAERRKVDDLRAELAHAEQRRIDLLDDYQARLATAQRRATRASANAIRECATAFQDVIVSHCRSRSCRLLTPWETAEAIAKTALESLAKEGDDGPR